MNRRSCEYPRPSSSAATNVIRANKKTDTRPELLLRSKLWRDGFRFRKHHRITIGDDTVVADIAFVRDRVAVFVDGCFWHGCPAHGTSPRTNSSYWETKLSRNRTRDASVDFALSEAGWIVIRCWEHESVSQSTERIRLSLGRQK